MLGGIKLLLATPQKFTLVAGTGEGVTTLNAFDQALLNSGLGNLNLLKVSSILPPQAQFHETLSILPGTLTPTAYGAICSAKPGEVISAAVGVGVPEEETFGVIMECSDRSSKADIEAKIIEMVNEAIKTRNLTVREIKVCVIEHRVRHCGCAFAGVALWY
jgi:arginine decarboxylase